MRGFAHRGLCHTDPGFRFTPVVSNPNPHWPGKTGYVAEHLEVAEMRDQPFDLYLCGPPPMVESIKDWRQQHGPGTKPSLPGEVHRSNS